MFGWLKRRRIRIKTLYKDVHQTNEHLQALHALAELDAEKTFRFPMLGEEIRFFLPYASFDFIQREILLKADFFEGNILRYIRQTYFNGRRCCVLDVGGNIGNHAVFFSRFCNAEVTTFEPQPAIFKILSRNLELNAPGVTAHNLALGENEGHASIEDYNSSNTGGTRLTSSESGEFVVRALDSFNFRKIDFMKIDVEGFEANVLNGARETITREKPVIWIEIFPENFETVSAILQGLGYELREQLAEADFIFVPTTYH